MEHVQFLLLFARRIVSSRISHQSLLIALGLLMIAPSVGFEQNLPDVSGIYRGKLGKQLEVVMRIYLNRYKNENEISGEYFYAKRGIEIRIKGTLQGGDKFEFDEFGESSLGGPITGHWSGRIDSMSSPQTISGIWSDPLGSKMFPFFLKKTAKSSDHAEFERLKPVFEISALPGAPKILMGEVEFQMAYVPKNNTNVSLPLLIKYKNKKILDKVNGTLRDMLRGMVCSEAGNTGGYENTSSVEYAAHDILSIQIHSSYFCGGAHPNNDNNSVTFDLRSGKVVDFPDLFESFEGKKTEILKTLYAGHIAEESEVSSSTNSENDDKCPKEYKLEELQEYSTIYYISKQGLVVQPEFPHVNAACAFPVTVPFSKAASLASSASILSRLQ